MSTRETVPKNPLEGAEGLSPGEISNAEVLQYNRRDAHEVMEETGSQTARDEMGPLHGAVVRGLDRHLTRQADRSAARHYKVNEGAYQEQAVIDAAAEGVKTSFSTGSKE
jgi:hypothetical protein